MNEHDVQLFCGMAAIVVGGILTIGTIAIAVWAAGEFGPLISEIIKLKLQRYLDRLKGG